MTKTNFQTSNLSLALNSDPLTSKALDIPRVNNKTNTSPVDNSDNLSNKSLEVKNSMSERFIFEHEIVYNSRAYNYVHSHVPIFSKLNIDFFKFGLHDYTDKDILPFLEYGFPLGAEDPAHILTLDTVERNHKGAVDYPNQIDEFLRKEILRGSVVGPFDRNPFSHGILISPLNSVPKKDSSERRIILDLSAEGGGGLNALIDKDVYLGEIVGLTYPRVDDLVAIIKSKGRGCHMLKKDLSRAYRQIPIDPMTYI